MRIAEILISTNACGTTMRRTNKARCESKADVAAISCIRPSSGASFSCEFPPNPCLPYWRMCSDHEYDINVIFSKIKK